MGTLYVVPTPIGNLEDITLRALRVLREVALIAAEDTRTTGRLLAHFEIDTPQISYHEHNKIARLDRVLDALAMGDVALVSDAGTPGLSDPGYELIRAALDAGVRVEPLPGASAVIPALVGSGLPTDSFTYLGFLPRRSGARRAALEAVADAPRTLVMYEAPHRLLAALEDVRDVLGEREVCVVRELSKLHEEFWHSPVSAAIEHFTETAPRGEITLVVDGAGREPEQAWDEADVREAFAAHMAAGLSRSAAAKAASEESGWPRRKVYDLDV